MSLRMHNPTSLLLEGAGRLKRELSMELDDQSGLPASGWLARFLDEARRGDAEAMGRALEPFRDYLLLVANEELDQALRSKVGASDLVQDTFLGAHRDLSSFRGRT